MDKNWTSTPGLYWSLDTREIFIVYSDKSIWVPQGWTQITLREVHDKVSYFGSYRTVDDSRVERIGDIPESMLRA